MDIVTKSRGELIPYENNPRHNDEAVEYVANSIKEFGWKVPVVIDKNNVVVAGHTRLKAAEMLGIDEIPCIIADDLSEDQIKAYRIADNKVADKAYWDTNLLGEEIKGLPEFDMTDFGFGDFELTMLFEDYEPEEYDNEMVQKYAEHEDEYLAKKRIIVTYTEEQEQALADMLGLQDIKKVSYDIGELL